MITGLTDEHWKVISKALQIALLNANFGERDFVVADELLTALGYERLETQAPELKTKPCKYCGADIVFAQRSNGWIALDPVPLQPYENYNSSTYILKNSGPNKKMAILIKTSTQPRYVSHGMVCGTRDRDRVPHTLRHRWQRNRDLLTEASENVITDLQRLRNSL